MRITLLLCAIACTWLTESIAADAAAQTSSAAIASAAAIRTPQPGPAPHLNSAPVFGVRPGHPFLYHIPATGDRPMQFSADGLPAGLTLDASSGQITGTIDQPGEHVVTLHAKNAEGTDAKAFKIVVGDTIALTPPMGWSSWNHYGSRISAELVLANAQGMAKSGLIDHGYTYMNIDDAWQGQRGGEFHGIQGNEKFPDMKGLADSVHALGLKIGIYSTPWVQSYAGYTGGSAENAEGKFVKNTGDKKGRVNHKILPWAIGRYHFAANDAKQWAAWGMDYLKYDWNPNELPETKEMYEALRNSGRDIVLSLSNSTPYKNIPELREFANSWRISGDIKANWKRMISEALTDEKWVQFQGPGHWNDPDMLEIANKERGQPGLTPDEEYTHMTWWCLLSAPLLLGNDLSQKLDDFTLNVLTNDEVIAVDQDALGQQAVRVGKEGDLLVYAKKLADGSLAVGFFNLGTEPAEITANWPELKLTGKHAVRDLWRQKNLGDFVDSFAMKVAPHSAELVKIAP